ncbi:MAG: ABC transporter ATP-binding protein [Myxococcaceae bacterium]|nr:ABC transporter ATP-binding protein [Myxococcaceae bacterium]
MSLTLSPGERLAVVGENGAGKSSLMNVLYGLYQPDVGQVRFGGETVRLSSPKDAVRRGIGMVHQHFALVPTLTVAENVMLGHEPLRRGLLDARAAREEVVRAAKAAGFALDPDATVGGLTVGSQQKVEILKALARGAKTLILDEPTAVLTPQEADELFASARALSEQGTSVVLISHKLAEVLAFATRIAVLRRGKLVRADLEPAKTSPAELAALMVGEGVALDVPTGSGVAAGAKEVLRLERLEAKGLARVSLTVRAGEVVGIAGVDGNGQRELAEVLTGARPWTAGTFTLLGQQRSALTPADCHALGIAHVPEDRLRDAVVKDLTVEENVALGRHGAAPNARGPWVDVAGRHANAVTLMEASDVRPREPLLRLGELSGGNQQKLVVGRELQGTPTLVVAVQPTRGLDLLAVAEVRRRLRQVADAGAGVLVVSLDLDEVRALADTIVVLAHGRVTGTFARGEADERELGRRMLAVSA